ncbi:sulfofructose kinase [Rhodoferax ferrireducens]|uniref:Sulfofructose kinase n=1 Tax=Rhodoferax ferrireducens TaxID=192843 RepID=A0ABU2C7Y6_9BURK|nr:PfkB family carbohydrate kinase [Rhodoferax ferrireducens]MDR7377451.1 sulfofructose kinase [Rhodoferax ferrireducens]
MSMDEIPGIQDRAAGPRISTVGHAALDHCFDIAEFPSQPTKTPAQAYRMVSGGMAANAAIAAARLGARVGLFGAVGDDEAGRFLAQRVHSYGVDCQGLQRVPGATSSISAVVIDAQGERQIFNCRGDALRNAEALDVSFLRGSDVVMVDPRWMAGAITALRWSRTAGVLSMLDGDLSPQEDLQTLSPLADWSVFSESGLAAFAPALSVDAALQSALDAGTQVAVVTLGPRGVRWKRGSEGVLHTIPSFPVKALDTNGAGDVFHAALALALAQGQGDRSAIRFAAAAAALKCQRNGGVVNGPDRAELDQFLATQS